MILLPDAAARRLVWQLAYSALSSSDLQLLTSLFAACAGTLRSFTFIDPTDNMLAFSTNLQAPVWSTSPQIVVRGGAPDPYGGTTAFVLTNNGQAVQTITQTLNVPAAYQYCFSIYAMSSASAQIVLSRQGSAAQAEATIPISSAWNRIAGAGVLNDLGTKLTVGVQLAPGQQVTVYGPQLEAQIAPSRYRPTAQKGGVYATAHWGLDQFPVTAQAPNLFATEFSIETAIED